MIRAVLVDDHPLARRGLQAILDDAGDVEVVHAVGSPDELPTGWADDGVDLVLLDLYHDGEEPCLSAVADLLRLTRVLVVSASGRPSDVLGAIRVGAGGYVTKLSDPTMLVGAVRTVAAGGFALSPQLADILQSQLCGVADDASSAKAAAAARETRSGLSPREEEALNLIACGFTHAQTATRMRVSKATVDTYVERIRAKLQVGNKAELTRAALMRFGLQ